MIDHFFIYVVFLLQLTININANNANEAEGEFVSKLFTNILNEDREKNIIISPVSIRTCVGMAFFGSDGQTANEIENALYFGTSDKQVVAETFKKLLTSSANTTMMNIANKIFINNNEIKSEFNEVVMKAFNSEAEIMDFSNRDESAKKINDWVEEQTNRKIKNLISSNVIDPEGSLLLVNAIYFKGKWSQTFSRITKNNFWTSDINAIEVDMMHNTKFFKYAEYEHLNANAIEMKYEDSEFSMMIILPNERNGILELENKLTTIDFIDLSNKMNEEFVSIQIPKFHIEFTVSLKSVLEKMGIKDMFTESANFSNLFQTGTVGRVSDVVHTAYIKVDENGSEAAAATYLKGVPTAGFVGSKPKKFKANHPFVFLIKDYESVYFIGHIIKF